jgi:hypothetical protein
LPQDHQISIRLNCQLAQFPARVPLPQDKVHVSHATLPGLSAQGAHGGFGFFQVLAMGCTGPGEVAAVETAGIHNV